MRPTGAAGLSTLSSWRRLEMAAVMALSTFLMSAVLLCWAMWRIQSVNALILVVVLVRYRFRQPSNSQLKSQTGHTKSLWKAWLVTSCPHRAQTEPAIETLKLGMSTVFRLLASVMANCAIGP